MFEIDKQESGLHEYRERLIVPSIDRQECLIISHSPEEGYQSELNVESAIKGMKELMAIEVEEAVSAGEFSSEAEDYVIYAAYPLYRSTFGGFEGDEYYSLERSKFSLATRDTIAAQQKQIEELENEREWVCETLVEINPSNYDHADVCEMNSKSVEVILALSSKGGSDNG